MRANVDCQCNLLAPFLMTGDSAQGIQASKRISLLLNISSAKHLNDSKKARHYTNMFIKKNRRGLIFLDRHLFVEKFNEPDI